MAVAAILLVNPSMRRYDLALIIACIALFTGRWIDKGMGLVVGGFTPNPFERVTDYWPTAPEVIITLGIWATGFFILTVLFKIAVSVKEEIAA